MKICVVVTTINKPNKVMEELARGCQENGWDFIAVGDSKSPANWQLEGCEYWSLDAQLESGSDFAKACPKGLYSRKNFGYLAAMRKGADIIIETDDDNMPVDGFFNDRVLQHKPAVSQNQDWVNVLKWFTDAHIWPRGLHLPAIRKEMPNFDNLPTKEIVAPVQQGLADGDPDVDSLYRLIMPLPQTFRNDRTVAFGQGSFVPFNAQNTTWFRDAFDMLYLPALCGWRMPDIWRGYIYTRISTDLNWHLLYHGPTVFQDRNEHDLMIDFTDEVDGYVHNGALMQELVDLDLEIGPSHIRSNIRKCYDIFYNKGVIQKGDRELLESWFSDADNSSLTL